MSSAQKKIIRITTVPLALRFLLPGQMRFMKENGFDVLMISADGEQIPDIVANEGVPHIVVPMTRKITPFRDLQCLFQLIHIFRKEKPDIVHSHTPKAGLLGMLAAKICGVKVRIHTVAGLPLMVEKGFKLQLLRLVEKITSAAANHVWPNSLYLKKYMIDNGLASPRKLKVILKGSTNGINLQRYSRNALLHSTTEKIKRALQYDEKTNTYLLCVARMVADKGIPELVNVFISLQKENASLKLILVGPFEKDLDPLPAHTMNQIASHPSVVHIPWSDEVEYFMTIADYFIFPSHREGFPNVLLQAGAMGLPIICSDISGNIDIVTHGETGLLFKRGSEAEMKDAISTAIQNREGSEKMARHLHEKIHRYYDRQSIWNALLQEYNDLTKG